MHIRKDSLVLSRQTFSGGISLICPHTPTVLDQSSIPWIRNKSKLSLIIIDGLHFISMYFFLVALLLPRVNTCIHFIQRHCIQQKRWKSCKETKTLVVVSLQMSSTRDAKQLHTLVNYCSR